MSFRLPAEEHTKLVAMATQAGLSPGGYARDALIRAMAQSALDRRGVVELLEEVQKLRSEHALATEAVLTVVGSKDELTHKEASTWVRKHLNR